MKKSSIFLFFHKFYPFFRGKNLNERLSFPLFFSLFLSLSLSIKWSKRSMLLSTLNFESKPDAIFSISHSNQIIGLVNFSPPDISFHLRVWFFFFSFQRRNIWSKHFVPSRVSFLPLVLYILLTLSFSVFPFHMKSPFSRSRSLSFHSFFFKFSPSWQWTQNGRCPIEHNSISN